MRTLLSALIREEWRLHAALFDYRLFALFPLMLAIMAGVSTVFLPLLRDIMPGENLSLLAHSTFMLFGLSVGAFGLLGRDILTRRFGQTQLLATAVRILPLTDRRILAAFFVKDLLFYLLLWVGPVLLGFGTMALLIGMMGLQVGLLALTLSLSFLFGLAVAFALSTLYAHSPPAFLLLLSVLVVAGALALLPFSEQGIMMMPPCCLLGSPKPLCLATTVAIILTCLALSLAFPQVDYATPRRRFPTTFHRLVKMLPAGVHAPYVAKDLLDLKRSQGGLGKIVFSLVLPAAVVWLLFYVLEEFIPGIDFLVVFSLFVGLIASSTYNWLTELDSFASYSFLPVSRRSILQSKVRSYALLSLVSLGLLLAATLVSDQWTLLVPALLAYAGIAAYTVAITVYLTGPYPTVLLYNVQVFGLYTLLIAPLLLLFLFVSVLHPWYLVGAVLLLPLSHYILQHAYRRWDSEEWGHNQ